MNALRFFAPSTIAVLVAVAGLVSTAHAVTVDGVGYSPITKTIQGQLAYSASYDLSITAPQTLQAPAQFPITVTLHNLYQGTDDAQGTITNYLKFQKNGLPVTTLTFSQPKQTQIVTVVLTFPQSATPGVTYGYHLSTSGWGSSGFDNAFATVNATVTPPSTPTAPVVTIVTPLDGATIVANNLTPSFDIPFSFTAISAGLTASAINSVDADYNGPGIRTSSADPTKQIVTANVVEGLLSVGIGTLAVTSTGTLHVTAAGDYSVTARATNSGPTAVARIVFHVVTNLPQPTAHIDTPVAPNNVFNVGSPIPYTFTGRSTAGAVRTLTALVDGVEVGFNPVGLNSPTATGSVTLPPYATVGAHTLSVVVTDDNGRASDTGSFTVIQSSVAPTITSDPRSLLVLAGTSATFTVAASGTPTPSYQWKKNDVNIDGATSSTLAFASASTGDAGNYKVVVTNSQGSVTSNTATLGVVTSPANALVTAPVPASFTTSITGGQGVITYKWQRSTNAGGSYVDLTGTPYSDFATAAVNVNPTAVVMTGDYFRCVVSDGVGTVTTNPGILTVLATPPLIVTVSGTVFLDKNTNGTLQTTEVGLGGITVKIFQGTSLVGATTSAANGAFTFSVPSGSGAYTVDAIEPTGMLPTAINPTVNVGATSVTGVNLGLYFNFTALRGMNGAGMSQGYWKNNISKNLATKTSGTQETLANLQLYTGIISSRTPYIGLTLQSALTIFGSGDQPKLQLLASEYNLASGRLINGSGALTGAFIAWGESVYNDPASTAVQKTFMQGWMDAFNNSHGGPVVGPLP